MNTKDLLTSRGLTFACPSRCYSKLATLRVFTLTRGAWTSHCLIVESYSQFEALRAMAYIMGFFTEVTDKIILFMNYSMLVFDHQDRQKTRHVSVPFNLITWERLIILNQRSSDTNMILVSERGKNQTFMILAEPIVTYRVSHEIGSIMNK